MAIHLLSDVSLRAIKLGDPRSRLSDGSGLYLLLFVKGGAHGWRFDYSFAGRRKTLSLGTYPDVSLGAARKTADAYRALVATGTDPSDQRKRTKEKNAASKIADEIVKAGSPHPKSFEGVARDWFAVQSPKWADNYSNKSSGGWKWSADRSSGGTVVPEVRLGDGSPCRQARLQRWQGGLGLRHLPRL